MPKSGKFWLKPFSCWLFYVPQINLEAIQINLEAINLNQGFSLALDFGNASPNLAMLQFQPSDNQQLVISLPKSAKVRKILAKAF
ncbi:hypothetical protein C7N43_03445 [Sphingobacteriales bacterium UPWRP_1]|nr:hypothetical protein BVG80_08850 [Sphingobacteriales bacterium TSM_CSM]PSJ78533.1 hypothetical protein C7N43_03445 [Sphingobacteriales bacterium UPWRP_1]